jgi:hypothetical protein
MAYEYQSVSKCASNHIAVSKCRLAWKLDNEASLWSSCLPFASARVGIIANSRAVAVVQHNQHAQFIPEGHVGLHLSEISSVSHISAYWLCCTSYVGRKLMHDL